MNSIELSTWITAFFVLAGFAAVLAVAGIAMVLPRRTAPAPAPFATTIAPAAVQARVLEGAGARS